VRAHPLLWLLSSTRVDPLSCLDNLRWYYLPFWVFLTKTAKSQFVSKKQRPQSGAAAHLPRAAVPGTMIFHLNLGLYAQTLVIPLTE